MHKITSDELNFGPLNITSDLMVRYRHIERYSGSFGFSVENVILIPVLFERAM